MEVRGTKLERDSFSHALQYDTMSFAHNVSFWAKKLTDNLLSPACTKQNKLKVYFTRGKINFRNQ